MQGRQRLPKDAPPPTHSPTTMMLNSKPIFMALIFTWSSMASMPTCRCDSQGGEPGLDDREEPGDSEHLGASMGLRILVLVTWGGEGGHCSGVPEGTLLSVPAWGSCSPPPPTYSNFSPSSDHNNWVRLCQRRASGIGWEQPPGVPGAPGSCGSLEG